MDYNEAVSWIAYATKIDGAGVIALQLTDKQTINIGFALSENKLLNPPRDRKLKAITFMCACPCKTLHTTTYRTKRPKYINQAHKQRAARNGASERRRIDGSPISCLSCMVRDVVDVSSAIEIERYNCNACIEGMLA